MADFFNNLGKGILKTLTTIDDVMYLYILIIVMAIAGLYFTIRTRGVQIRLFWESCKLWNLQVRERYRL